MDHSHSLNGACVLTDRNKNWFCSWHGSRVFSRGLVGHRLRLILFGQVLKALQPVGPDHLLLRCLRHLKDTLNFFLESANSALVSSVVSGFYLRVVYVDFLTDPRNLFSFRRSQTIFNPLEGLRRDIVERSIFHGKVDFLRDGMEGSFAGPLLPVYLFRKIVG